MIKFRVDSSGGISIARKSLASDAKLREAVNEGARAVRNIARQLVRSKDKTGREYSRPRGEGHQRYTASRPGEPPARFSGYLASHIRQFNAKSGLRPVALVAAQSPHAKLLEFGTVAMKARPFMGPAMKQARAQNFKNIKKAARATVSAAAARAAARIKR